MPLSAAQQAEVIRSNQKDDYYKSYIRGSLADIVQTFLGARRWIRWQKELDMLADLGYFGLTTLAGFQTLGEEYVNIVQVDPTRRVVPSAWRRLVMISLHAVSPYLIDKLLWWLQKELQSNANLHLTAEGRGRLLEGVSLLRHVITILHRCHLAAFYLRGVYYHIAKRLSSVRYLAVRGTSEQPANWGYKVLGWLAVAQLSFSFIQGLYKLKVKGKGHTRAKNPDIPQVRQSCTIEESTGSTSSKNICSLCLEVRKDSTATPCGHVFCWTCIAEWCASKPECPLCRDKFQISRLIYLQNFDPT